MQASSTATPEAAPGTASELKFLRRGKRKSIWTVDRIEGTKLIMNITKVFNYAAFKFRFFQCVYFLGKRGKWRGALNFKYSP